MPNQPADEIFLPSDDQLIAARAAISSLIHSIANGNLGPTSVVMDEITQRVVVAMRWRPPIGLTQEWALTTGGRQTVMSERAAKSKAERWPESFGVATRHVTRWTDA